MGSMILPALLDLNHARLRLMPITDETMSPMLNPGDLVAVVPVSEFRTNGLYVLEIDGRPEIWKAQHIGGEGVLLRKMAHTHPVERTTRERFAEMVIGAVFACCTEVDWGLLGD